MRTLIILAVIILGYVNAMGQQTVDLDKASQRLKNPICLSKVVR